MNKDNKNMVCLSEVDLLNSNEKHLLDYFEVADEDIENGYKADLFIDCDYIKLSKESERGDVAFVLRESNDVIYIITHSDIDKESEFILESWLQSREQYFDNDYQAKSWDDWSKIEKGIAYRGGSGYTYDLACLDSQWLTWSKRVIKSFSQFKEASRVTKLINPQSGKSKNTIELIYGFDVSRHIEAKSYKEAFKNYCKYYDMYDNYITKNSFLHE